MTADELDVLEMLIKDTVEKAAREGTTECPVCNEFMSLDAGNDPGICHTCAHKHLNQLCIIAPELVQELKHVRRQLERARQTHKEKQRAGKAVARARGKLMKDLKRELKRSRELMGELLTHACASHVQLVDEGLIRDEDEENSEAKTLFARVREALGRGDARAYYMEGSHGQKEETTGIVLVTGRDEEEARAMTAAALAVRASKG